MNLADVPVHDRPRERLSKHGAKALSDRELVALVLRGGTRGTNSLDLAALLVADWGGLEEMARARPEEIARRDGVGEAKATALVAAFELGRRAGTAEAPVVLKSARDVALASRVDLSALRREQILVLVCDAANRLRRTEVVSSGGVDSARAGPREVLNAVLRNDGRAFAIAHNHPSGDLSPSAADREATRSIADAARVVGLRFLGHVVVAGGATPGSFRWRQIPR